MARGKERQVICASCKRYCRRDKAVYIEKVVFSNPIERKDTTEQEEYRAVFKREVAYCPGCGKHLRIYEKKTEENRRNREREMERSMQQQPGIRQSNSEPTRTRKGGYRINEPTQPQSPTARQAPQAEKSELTQDEEQTA